MEKKLPLNNIMITVLITLVSNFSYELINTFINVILLPISDKNNNLNDYTIIINNCNIKMGLLIRSFIKFLFVILLCLNIFKSLN